MRIVLASILAVSLGVGFSHEQEGGTDSPQKAGRREGTYDGNWWLAAAPDERSGFLNGAADCLTWAAHAKGFSATPDQLGDKITRYYKTHSADITVLVTEVWRRLESREHPARTTPGAESWTNPHWYLDGLWWSQGSKSENVGFVEGYLWCATTYLKSSPDTYSRPVSYYVDQITGYTRSAPQADDEAVATILYRFRDQPKTK